MCSEKGSVQRDFQTGFKVSVFINIPGQPEFPTLTWSQFLRISPVELIFSNFDLLYCSDTFISKQFRFPNFIVCFYLHFFAGSPPLRKLKKFFVFLGEPPRFFSRIFHRTIVLKPYFFGDSQFFLCNFVFFNRKIGFGDFQQCS